MQDLKDITKNVKEILKADVHAVGGCVRDHSLKREPKDYDFTTPLDPDTIEQRVKDSPS